MRTSCLQLALFLTLAALALPGAALAQGQQSAVEVRIVLASAEGDGATDEELSDVGDNLRRQFPQFGTFRHHATQSFELTRSATHEVRAPGDSSLRITYLGPQNGQQRYGIEVRGGRTEVGIAPGRTVFIGGSRADAHTLIFVIRALQD